MYLIAETMTLDPGTYYPEGARFSKETMAMERLEEMVIFAWSIQPSIL